MNKRKTALFIATIIITTAIIGCHQQPGPGTKDSTLNKTDITDSSSATDAAWYPAHRTKGENSEDIVFIGPLHGWKMESNGVAMGSQSVTLFKTVDGGKAWVKISETVDPNKSDADGQQSSAIPFGGLKTGITFLDEQTGWIGMDEPAPQPEIYVTHDGGQTWERQELPIMENSGLGGFVLSPPAFFTKQDGIIIFNNVNSLWYVTHDGGENWILCQDASRSSSNGNLHWDFSGTDKDYDPVMNGNVTIEGVTWITKDGGHTWATAEASSSTETEVSTKRIETVEDITNAIVKFIDSNGGIQKLTAVTTNEDQDSMNSAGDYFADPNVVSSQLAIALNDWAPMRNIDTMGFSVNCIQAKAMADDLPGVLILDYARESHKSQGFMIFWSEEGKIKFQAISMNPMSETDSSQLTVLSARICRGQDGSIEMGLQLDGIGYGNGGWAKPWPVFELLSMKNGVWSLLWSAPWDGAPSDQWQNNHGVITYTGDDLSEFTLTGDSLTYQDGKENILEQRKSGALRYLRQTWKRTGNSFERSEFSVVASTYNTLLEFIYAISSGKEQQAYGFVNDKSLIEKAKKLHLVQKTLDKQCWVSSPSDDLKVKADAYTSLDPIFIIPDEKTGKKVKVSFVAGSSGSKYLISGLEEVEE